MLKPLILLACAATALSAVEPPLSYNFKDVEKSCKKLHQCKHEPSTEYTNNEARLGQVGYIANKTRKGVILTAEQVNAQNKCLNELCKLVNQLEKRVAALEKK